MIVRLYALALLSSRPIVAEMPLPNWAVYWMLLMPVTVS
jgi:hypothetical protein